MMSPVRQEILRVLADLSVYCPSYASGSSSPISRIWPKGQQMKPSGIWKMRNCCGPLGSTWRYSEKDTRRWCEPKP